MYYIYLKSEDERERSSFEWVLLSFNEMYKLLERKQSHVNRSVDNWKPDISDVEYLSETFVKGQHVGRTSVWLVNLCSFWRKERTCQI